MAHYRYDVMQADICLLFKSTKRPEFYVRYSVKLVKEIEFVKNIKKTIF